MSKKTESGRTLNVSVIGLSGLDQEKSLYGVGKSCLCNRFVRPLADEYIPDHSSIYSSTDFAGRVINNDHFIYWGSVVKELDDGTDVSFQLIEQTEFIEDSTLTTLSRGGQMSSYAKRCTALKLQSQEKLMYISRDQVALQNDYEQISLPGGKFNVDGFVCVYDVSSRGRSDEQEMLYSSILSTLQKTKKPVVVAATKCDDLRRNSLDECHKLFTSKKLTNVPIVEVSAEENVNVDLVFMLLAQLIEKGRIRSRITPYSEAVQIQKERVETALEKYQRLVEKWVSNFQSIWKNTKKIFELEQEYLAVRDLCGIDTCKKIFNKHIRRLKKEAEDVKLDEYLMKIPAALNDMFPTLVSVESFQQDWTKCQTAIRNHRDFDKWFMQLSNGSSWQDSENLIGRNFLVPVDVLSRDEAQLCFTKHVEKLKEAELCSRMKKEFKRLLQLTPQIQPGTPWDDAVLLLKNEESYKYLNDSDKLDIFEGYQSEIRAQGRVDFQELLFESAKLFANFGQSCRPTVENLHQICNELMKDERYRRLDKLPNERDKLLWNHIALIHSPTRCLSGEGKCMDQLIQDLVATTDQRPLSSFLTGSNDTFESDDSLVTLIIVGSNGLAKEFAQGVEKRCYGEHMEFPFENKLYELDIKIVDDEENESDVFAELDDICTTGLCCVFSSRDSLNYVETYLERSIGQSDDILREDVPIVLVFAQDPVEKEVQKELRSKAQELANRYNCVFIDIHISHFYRDQLITDTQVDEGIKNILEGIKNQSRSRYASDDIKEPDPDLRILLCANCGDPYPVELILGPLFTNQSCSKCPNRNDSVMLETFVGSEKKKVMITFTSYHRAYSLNYQKFHGYILVYSAVRSASLSTLSVYASSIPAIPIQVLATTGSYSGASVVFHSNVAKTLLADGTNLASKLSAKFQTTSPQFQYQAGAFTVFFNRVWEKKRDSEAVYAQHLLAFSVDTLPRRKHDPLPEVPPSPRDRKTKRERCYSERHYETPTLMKKFDIHSSASSLASKPHAFEFSVVDDDDVSPYAVVKRSSYPRSLNENIRLFTSTPTPNASSGEEVNPYAFSTPLKPQPFQQTENPADDIEHLYSKVDRAAVLKAMEVEEPGRSNHGFIHVRIENPYASSSEVNEHSGMLGGSNTPPPVPQRTVHELLNDEGEEENEELGNDENKDDPGYATIRSTVSNNHDEGYSTVEETLSRGTKLRPRSEDPYEMRMKDKINFFGERIIPPYPSANRSFPSDSLRRLHDKRVVPGLIKQFSDSAPLAQAEESEVPDYASIEDIRKKTNRHSTIPEITNYSDTVVLRTNTKETPRASRSADESMLAELIGNAANAATKKRLESRRSPQRRMPAGRSEDLNSPNSEQASPVGERPLPGISYSVCSDDGQTADDEATIDRSKKLRIPSIRRPRKSSPMPSRRASELEKRPSRDRKRKDQEKQKEKNITRSRSVPRNFNPLTRRYETNVMIAPSPRLKYNSLRMDLQTTTPRPDDGESFTEEDTEDDTLSRKRKKDEKEAERNRKREEKRQKKQEKMMKKKEDRIRKKEEEFRRKKMSKGSGSKYFGQPLTEISPENSLVPLFLTRCIDFVEASGMHVRGIYRVSGNKGDVEAVLQKFEDDPSKDFSEFGVTIHAVTGALKSFFTKLPGALIPSDNYDGIMTATTIMDANERFSELRKIMKLMPPHNYAVFKRLMFHLNKVTEQKELNMMESRNLAIVFWPTLAPPVIASIDNFSRTMNMCLFVQTYIEHCEELFKNE